TIKELADAMSLSQATVTSIMDRLENRHLILRVRSQTDKRKIHPQLTADGNALLDNAPTLLQDDFVRKFKQLHDWEQHMIIASIQRVAEMMDADGIDASPFLDIGSLDRSETPEECCALIKESRCSSSGIFYLMQQGFIACLCSSNAPTIHQLNTKLSRWINSLSSR